MLFKVTPTVDEFAQIFEMDKNEKERFVRTLRSLISGDINGLPKYIIDSASEGLNVLAEKLAQTGFFKP